MSDSYGKVGFASPVSANKVIKRRGAVLELIATVGLAVCLVIAITAVSIGAAHAWVLRAVGEHRDASLAIASSVVPVTAGIVGMGRRAS